MKFRIPIIILGILVPLRTKAGFTDFETPSKDWFNALLRDDIDWNLHKGGVTNWKTGKKGDHTTGTGKFLFVDTSGAEGDSALLESRILRTTVQGSCVSFWYRMSGENVGMLKLHKVQVVGWKTFESIIWRRDGHQGHKWNYGRVTIPSSSGSKHYQLVLEANLGEGGGGVIAVDDIFLGDRYPCPDFLSNGGFVVDFETKTRAMQNKKYGDHFDWTIHRGRTPSRGTGPSHDVTSGTGHYLYIETSEKTSGQRAYYISRGVSPSPTGACLSFYYHMLGQHVGKLTVSVLGRSGWVSTAQTIWSKTGNQGDVWHFAEVSLSKRQTARNYDVMFTGIAGSGYQGDIAIDDVMLQNTRVC